MEAISTRSLVFARLKAFHLNDSKRELGSRVDRHENIGQGHLGEECVCEFATEIRVFIDVPMYLETPEGSSDDSGRDLDVVNLELLRGLLG